MLNARIDKMKFSKIAIRPVGQRKLPHPFSFPPKCDLLLLEIPSLLLVHQHQVQIVSERRSLFNGFSNVENSNSTRRKNSTSIRCTYLTENFLLMSRMVGVKSYPARKTLPENDMQCF